MHMLKTVFIGSKNEFDEVLVHWLSQRTELVGVVWTQSTAWKQSWRGVLKFAHRRYRRYGLLKVTNEILFYLYYYARLFRRDVADMRRHIIEPYHAQNGIPSWQGDAIFSANVNSPEVLAFLDKRRPDIGLAMCISDFFGKRLRAIPKEGIFLWHEGITPEYKGLYSPFWAVHNLDFSAIGYTLLLMNDVLDGGGVYVQGRAQDVDPFRQYHGYLGHKAIIDSLPAVEQFLVALEAGAAAPIDRTDAVSNTYTYPGLFDLIRQRKRLRRTAR